MDDEDSLNSEQSNEEISKFYNSAQKILIRGYANGYVVEFLPNQRQLHLPNIRPFYWRVEKAVKIERIEFGPPEDETGPLSLRLKFYHLYNVIISYGGGGYNYIEVSPITNE